MESMETMAEQSIETRLGLSENEARSATEAFQALELTPEEEKAIMEFEPPDFTFLGTDGRDYFIGNSPAVFEDELYKVMDRLGTIGATSPSVKEFVDLWNRWIWMHLITVDNQRNITLEDVPHIYFVIDRPQIIGYILRRFTEGVEASAKTLDLVSEFTGFWLGQVKAMKEAHNGGNHQQENREASLQPNDNPANNIADYDPDTH